METLENKVAALEARIAEFDDRQNIVLDRPAFPVGKVSEKYKALAEFLYEKWEKKVELSYAKIEDILGFHLPSTAYNLPQSYWANTKTHSYASAWMALGYKAKVSDSNNIVIFERSIY